MIEQPIESLTVADFWTQLFDQVNNPALESEIDRLCHNFISSQLISSKLNAEEVMQQFEFSPISDMGCEPQDFIDELESHVLPHAINTGSPYFIGHMTALLPNFMRPLAKLVATLNQNQVKLETAKSMTFFEHQALAILHQAFYQRGDKFYKALQSQPHTALGVMTSGGTLANATALQCARNEALSPFGDVEQEGLLQVMINSGYQRSVVICSSLSHYSIKKTLGTLGLGRNNLLQVKVDQEQRMDLQALQETIAQCRANNWQIIAIVAVAGTTECGSFDDIEAIAGIAASHDIHLHVDAAWGGAMIFSERHAGLLRGIEQADSITIDAHKQLYTPIGSGIALFKNPELIQHISTTANYIIRKGSQDLGRHSMEGSRPAMVIYLQATLQLLGRQGLGALLDKNVDVCRTMAEYIAASNDFELLTQPQSNIFLYRYLPPLLRGKNNYTDIASQHIDDLNIKLQEIQKRRGRSLVSRTQLMLEDGISVVGLRVVIANPTTHFKHCLQVLNEQREIARELLS
jgi:putative pyridoxal-dependent aspartate 1-decarboxylase